MAQVKVINEFNDRYTGKLHKIGEVFETDDKRISEIMEVSKHLIEVQEDKEPAKRTRKKVGED